MVENFVRHCNDERLYSSINYITSNDKLNGRSEEIFSQREVKLETAWQARISRQLMSAPLTQRPEVKW